MLLHTLGALDLEQAVKDPRVGIEVVCEGGSVTGVESVDVIVKVALSKVAPSVSRGLTDNLLQTIPQKVLYADELGRALPGRAVKSESQITNFRAYGANRRA